MTGLPNDNRGAFEAARTILRAKGHFVLCPAELDIVANTGTAAALVNYRAFLIRDVAMLLTCDLDGIVLLDGWLRSKGARLEVQAGLTAGLSLYALGDDGELSASVCADFNNCDFCRAATATPPCMEDDDA
jgi:hypothetical protein